MNASAAQKEAPIQIAECTRCEYRFVYPRAHCRVCGGLELRMSSLSGEGTLYSFTVVRAHPDPEVQAQTPYIVGYVDLDQGVRVLATVLTDAADVSAAIGDRVHVEVRGGRVQASLLRSHAHVGGTQADVTPR